jgi:hypothetical protein
MPSQTPVLPESRGGRRTLSAMSTVESRSVNALIRCTPGSKSAGAPARTNEKERKATRRRSGTRSRAAASAAPGARAVTPMICSTSDAWKPTWAALRIPSSPRSEPSAIAASAATSMQISAWIRSGRRSSTQARTAQVRSTTASPPQNSGTACVLDHTNSGLSPAER